MFKTLLKINLKAMFSTMFRRKNAKPGASGGRKAGRLVLIALLAVYAVAMMMFSIGSVFASLIMQPDGTIVSARYYFALLGILVFCFAFIGSVFTTKNLLFRARDNELLLSMPIPPIRILASRVAVLLVLEAIYTLLMAVPAGLVWFRAAGFSAALLLRLLLSTFLLLLCAAAVTGFFGWLLALLDTKFAKSEMIQSVLSLALLVGYFLVVFNMQRYLTVLSDHQSGVSDAIRKYLTLFDLYGQAVGGSVAGLLLLAAAALIPFGLICLLLSRSFLRLSTDKKATRHRTKIRAQAGMRTPHSALLIKELRQFFSLPLYLLNCGLGCVMELLIAGLLFFKRDAVEQMLVGVEFSAARVAIPLIALCFCISTINTCAVSLSLERKRIDQLRAMPLPAKTVYLAKRNANLVIGLPTTLLAAVLMGLALQLPPAELVLVPVFCGVNLLLMSDLQLTANILLPKFNAISDAVLIKQSGSVLAALLIGFAVQLTLVLAVLGGAALLGAPAALAAVSALMLIICALFRRWFSHGATRRYAAMSA